MKGHSIRIGDKILPFDSPIPLQKTITIPARTEYIARVGIINDLPNGFVKKQTLKHNVFIPDTLVTNNNGTTVIPILNTDVCEQIIETPMLEIEEIAPCHDVHFADDIPINKMSSSRLETLMQNIRLNHLNQEEGNSILDICKDYNDIFHLPQDILTTTTTLKHEIPTTSDVPIHTKTYRYPKVHESEVENQINKMLKDNIIEPSTSPYSSPIWIVPKKNGLFRQTEVEISCGL